ncbi:MAG: hypothetical protein R3F61_12230 [Myxococcota bacterium]
MGITVASGPARIIDGGMVTCFMGNDLTITLTQPVDLVLEFAFETNDAQPDVAVNVATFENRMRLTCVNFDKDDGRGSAEPVFIGESGPLIVFMHFRVFRFGRTDDRTVHYTLYSVLKDDVGWSPLND